MGLSDEKYLICYDISDDSLRDKVRLHITNDENNSVMVQKSVYLISTNKEKEDIKKDIENIKGYDICDFIFFISEITNEVCGIGSDLSVDWVNDNINTKN